MGQWSGNAEASVATRVDTAIAAGLGNHLPIGDYGSADYRSAVRFAVPAGWSGWTSITSAALSFYISDHQHVGPKSSSIYCSRMQVTAPIWSKGAGSQNCESGFTGGNNTQATDIVGTTVDRVSFSSGSTANAKKSIDVTAAMRYYWANGAGTSKPVFVFDNNGAGEYTELWSVQKTGGYDIVLTINYTDQEPPTAPTPTGPGNGTTSLTDTPTFSWTHNDPQGDAQANAEVRIFDAGGSTLLYTWNPTAPSNQSLVAPSTLLRGTTYQWEVRTADAAMGYGPYSARQTVTIKANPVVTIDTTRYMDFNGAPRLRVHWSVNQTQASYRVTASGYNSGIINNGTQDHLLDTLAISDNVPVSITVEVWTNEGLYNYAAYSFRPRYGLTVHRRDLGAAPLNWGGSSEQKTVPAGCQLIVEYGSDAASVAAPGSGWQASLGSVPKQRYVFWRAWFIPSATQGPTLDRVTITSDATAGKSVDKWLRWQTYPAPALPFGSPWALDESEYVYGTRSVRMDCNGTWQGLRSEAISVKPGRSYILTGLMKSKGNSGGFFFLIDTLGNTMKAEDGTNIESAKLAADTPWFSETSQDVNRYKTPIWVATTDTVYVLLAATGAAGTQAWFDALKLEESTVATPWSPASIGATVIDAGGVQIDGNKGGILRYKGTDGLARSVVEGGSKGLVFGGDTLVHSPSGGVLAIGDDAVGPGQLTVSGGPSGNEGGQIDLIGSGANPDWSIDSLGASLRMFAEGTVRLALATTSPHVSVGGDLAAGNITASGVLKVTAGVWHVSSDNAPRLHFAVNSRSYYRSPNGHQFQGSADQTLAVLDDGGGLNAIGGLYENGVRLVQPAGLRIQRGTVLISATTTNVGTATATFSPAFSSTPVVVVSPGAHNGWYGVVDSINASNCRVLLAQRDGTNASISNVPVQWIAIGPA